KTKFRKVYQEIDDVPAFEPVTKWNATVDAVERFPDMLRQAFRVATSGAPGPVHLQFRGNEGQLDQEEAEMEPLVEPQFARVPAFRPRPDLDDLKKALQHLEKAERPVIVAAAADLVFFIGTSAGGMTTHAWTVPKIGVPAIQIDIEAETIGRNYPVKVGILGDAKVTLAALLKLSSNVQRSKWLEQVKSICREWQSKYQPALESDAAPMRPERICAELSRHVPED